MADNERDFSLERRGKQRGNGPITGPSAKVDVVTTWNDPDEIGDRVARYLDVRCPECDRMLWCLHWDAVGYPDVHCDACGFRSYWPFEEIDGLEHRYRNGSWPDGGDP